MEVLDFYSECSEKFNTRVMREVGALIDTYEEAIPDWRAILELQRSNETRPYYLLDVGSAEDAGAAAPPKMEALKRFPERAHTGYQSMDQFLYDLRSIALDETHPELFQQILKLPSTRNMTVAQHKQLIEATGFSAWYGGIRLPYNILMTSLRAIKEQKELLKKAIEEAEDSKDVRVSPYKIDRKPGEIRVTFSGGLEWQDTFMAFLIMRCIQRAMVKCWKHDQFTFNPEKLKKGDKHVAFYAVALPTYKCPVK